MRSEIRDGGGTLNPAEQSARCAGGIKLHRQSRNESLCLQLEVVSSPSIIIKKTGDTPSEYPLFFGAGGGTLNPAEQSSATSCTDRMEMGWLLAA